MCQCDLALLLLFIVMVNDVQGLNRRGITERPSATCSSSSLARLLVGRGESSPPPAGSRSYIISPLRNHAGNPSSHSSYALGFQCRLVHANYRNSAI